MTGLRHEASARPSRPLLGPTTDSTYLKARLLHARTSLVEAHPFLGSLVLRLPVRITEDPRVDTACVDGAGNVSFDRTFLGALTVPELRTVLLHETLHLALDVLGRQGDRDPLRWNIAHDHAVNWLIEESFDADQRRHALLAWPRSFPPLKDPAFRHLSAEEIYDRLPRTASLEAALVDLRPDLGSEPTPEELATLRERWQAALVAAAEEAMGTHGFDSLPAWAKKLLGPLLRPQLPWQTLLAHKVQGRLAGRRRTFARPGRRSHAAGAVLPGAMRDAGVAGVLVDVSGSIGPVELSAFLSELGGILRDTRLPVRLITWDQDVMEDLLLESGDDLQVRLAAHELDLAGGGGTDPRCILAHLESPEGQELPLPSFAVLLTDGEVPWPDAAEWPFPVLVAGTAELPLPDLGYDGLLLPLTGATA